MYTNVHTLFHLICNTVKILQIFNNFCKFSHVWPLVIKAQWEVLKFPAIGGIKQAGFLPSKEA